MHKLINKPYSFASIMESNMDNMGLIWIIIIKVHSNYRCMGSVSNSCNQCQDSRKYSLAYGEHQLQLVNHRQCAIMNKIVSRHSKQQSTLITQQQLQCQFAKRKSIRCSHLVKLYNYSVVAQQQFFTVRTEYEYLPHTLKDKMHMYRHQGEWFRQCELINIVCGVETGLRALYENGIAHRCINLSTVLCINSFYKVTDFSANTMLTGYDLVRQGDKEQFLSDKLLNALTYRTLNPQYDLSDDLFSLGMLILTIIIDATPADFYSEEAKSHYLLLDKKVMLKAFRKLDRNFSRKLAEKVRALINGGIQEKEREGSRMTGFSQSLNEISEKTKELIDRVSKAKADKHF